MSAEGRKEEEGVSDERRIGRSDRASGLTKDLDVAVRERLDADILVLGVSGFAPETAVVAAARARWKKRRGLAKTDRLDNEQAGAHSCISAAGEQNGEREGSAMCWGGMRAGGRGRTLVVSKDHADYRGGRIVARQAQAVEGGHAAVVDGGRGGAVEVG